MGEYTYTQEQWEQFANAFIQHNGNYRKAAMSVGIEPAAVYNRKRSKTFSSWLREYVDHALKDQVLKDRIKLSKSDALDSAERQTMTLRMKLTGELNEKPEVHIHNDNRTFLLQDDVKDGLLDWGRNTGRIKLNAEVGRG